jgi:hypothetical protein
MKGNNASQAAYYPYILPTLSYAEKSVRAALMQKV